MKLIEQFLHNHLRAFSFYLCFMLIACSANPKQGWISLFDGQTLGKWEGDKEVWRVENGYLSGKSPYLAENTFLIYPEHFSDFILEAEVMLLEAGPFPNSGIQFRSRVFDSYDVQGYQVDLGPSYWGSLYNEGTGPLAPTTTQALQAIKSNDWNIVSLRVKDQQVNVLINGVQAAQYEELIEPTGIIALQYHAPGKNFEVRFRGIRLLEFE